MKLSRNHLITTSILIVFLVVTVVTLKKGLQLNPNFSANALKDRPAKNFSVELIQSAEGTDLSKRGNFSLNDFLGKPLILNFWASWCVSCRAEAHELEMFWRQHKSMDVQVVGIAVQDSRRSADAFIKKFGKTYSIGIDIDGKAGIDYGVTGVPETFFINAKGIIKDKIAGPVDRNILRKKLSSIMGE